MCTVSIFAQHDDVLITMNRDEQRTRFEAPAPHVSEHHFYPIDSASGGTWCGLHRNGSVFTLLNRYESQDQHTGTDSRGQIIPELLELTHYTSFFTTPNLYRFSPFDLLIISDGELRHFSWNGERLTQSVSALKSGPFFFTSSSERTEHVISYRHAIFNTFHNDIPAPNANEVLLKLHRVRDTEHPRDGILVDRPLVHTKSICQIIISSDAASIRYWPESALENCTGTLFEKTFSRSMIAQSE